MHIYFYLSPKDWLEWKNVSLGNKMFNSLKKWHCKSHFHQQIAPVTVWLGSCSKGMKELCEQESLWHPRDGSQSPARCTGSSGFAAGVRHAAMATEQALIFCLHEPWLSPPHRNSSSHCEVQVLSMIHLRCPWRVIMSHFLPLLYCGL